MANLKIANTTVIASRLLASHDRDNVVAAVKAALAAADENVPRRVLFIDTPPTAAAVETARLLLEAGFAVVWRDHHDVAGDPATPRDLEVRAAADELRALLGPAAVISNRRDYPACSGLFQVGEFADLVGVVVCDADPDGVMGALKALGVVYSPEDGGVAAFEDDAALLDGPRAQQQGLSPLGRLLAVGMSTLPPYNPNNPGPTEEAKGKLFASFVAAVRGDPAARADLEGRVAAYEAALAVARQLAATASEAAPGVVLVDTRSAPRHDLGTLAAAMEARPGARITVVLKDNGPIAGKHGGEQFSLAVARAHQQGLNIQSLLPAGFRSSPEAGIICNTSFLLHVSRKIWEEQVLPALKSLPPPA